MTSLYDRFLDDQALAAGEEAEQLIAGYPRQLPATHPVSIATSSRFLEQLRSGTTTTCFHLAGKHPTINIGVWVASTVDLISCRLCVRRLQGDPAASTTCAHCGRTSVACEPYVQRESCVILMTPLCAQCVGGGSR